MNQAVETTRPGTFIAERSRNTSPRSHRSFSNFDVAVFDRDQSRTNPERISLQRMEASEGVTRGSVVLLMKLVAALDTLGVELIPDNAAGQSGGRGALVKRAAS